jgi:hypothetical protein
MVLRAKQKGQHKHYNQQYANNETRLAQSSYSPVLE